MSDEIYLSIVIPGRNEEKRIGKTLDAVSAHLKNKNYKTELIYVDGGSTDKTVEVVESKKDSFEKLHVIAEGAKVAKHGGKGLAIKLGMLAAVGKYKCFIDADNGAPFEQIDKLFKEIDKYDIVIGSRYIEGRKTERGLVRTIISRGGALVFLIVLGERLKDTRCPLKLFRGDVAEKLFHLQKLRGFGFDSEILAVAQKKFKYTIKEVQVEFHDVAGSKVGMKDTLKSFWEVFQIRWFLTTGAYKDKK